MLQVLEDIFRRFGYCCRRLKHYILGPHGMFWLNQDGQLELVLDYAQAVQTVTIMCGGASATSIQRASLHYCTRINASMAAGFGISTYGEYACDPDIYRMYKGLKCFDTYSSAACRVANVQ